MVLGSSMAAKDQLLAWREREELCPVVTCNKGYKMWPVPHFWLLRDKWAIVNLREHYEDARKRGTKLVTLEGGGGDIEYRIDGDMNRGGPMEYRRGEIWNVGLSGMLMVQWAIQMGATELNLVGFEGYPKGKGEVAYFDGRVWWDGESAKDLKVSERQAELLDQMVRACPDIRFVWWGRPLYHVDEDRRNVRIIDVAPH